MPDGSVAETPSPPSWVGETLDAAGSWSLRAKAPSQGIAGEGMRLVDVFAPPLVDFSEKGWVDNAADYPIPSKAAS